MKNTTKKKIVKEKPNELDTVLKYFTPSFGNWKNDRYDWHSGIVEISYKRDYGSNCNCGSICRCSKIKDIEITSFDLDELIGYVLTDVKDIYLKYCVDRIIRLSSLSEHSFETPTCGGYYGDEVVGSFLDESINKDLHQKIFKLKELSDLDKIKYVLTLEYGYLLKEIEEAKSIEIDDISLDDLLGQEEYRKKVNISKDIYGEKFNLPLGIFLKRNPKYRLIDGYHRVVKAKSLGMNNVKGIILC
jgi:hypothetical protein